MADEDTGRRITRRSVAAVRAEEPPPSSPRRTRRSSAMALDLSNEECLAQYNTFKTQDDFLNSFEKSICEKFIRGAMKANKGSLPCMTCGKIVNTALGMVLHLNGRKCKAKTPEADGQNKETPVTERKRRRLAVKMEEPDEDDFIPEAPAPVSEKPKRARAQKKDKAVEVKSAKQLQDEPSLWLALSDEEKTKFLTNFYGAGPYPCFAVKTADKGDCDTFASAEDAIEHNNTCITPMYFTFKGDRLALLRSLPKTLRARFVREALQLHKEVQCLECPRLFTHVYGLIYHIERCNVDQSVAPWKCYRCGHITTMAHGQDHLSNCSEKVAESDYTPGDRHKERIDSDDLPKIFGCLDDVNLRSGKAIEKNETMTKVDAKSAVEKLVNMGIDIRMKRKATLKASVSAGVLPPESSRVRIVNSGVMRFRFRKAEITNTPTDLSGWDTYMAQMEEAVATWTAEKRTAILCDPLIGFPTTAWPVKDGSTLDFNKESPGFRFQEDPKNFYHTSTRPPELSVLMNFSSAKFDDDATRGSWLSMAYCGGPVHTLKFAPNRLSPEEEVLLVCPFPDDSSLVKGNFRDCEGRAQLWIVRHNPDSTSTLHPWVVIESIFGVILTACWLDIPRSEDDETFIGYLALGTSQGKVLIYSVDKQCLPDPGDKPAAASPNPLLILRQSVDFKADTGETGVVVHNPPITRIEWSTLDQAQFLAGVNAAGSVVFWDLTGDISNPKFLRDPAWSSPAQDLCFAKEYEMVVGFREKLVRVYDIRNWSCVLEENTVRTAGSRVVSCPRSLSGFLTFQSEYFASGEVPATGIAYVCSDNIANGYFVVPLANRHDLQMWDASVSSLSGITATCGVDGQLLLSANGRVVPRQSKADCGFSVMRPSLLLTRRRLEEIPPEANATRDCLFDYSSVCERTWLDITVNPNKNSQTATYSSLELRNESLNAVATNHFGRPVVATAGQAGLIFLRSCAIDKDTAFDPLDIISSLVAKKNPPKRKQGRPKKKRDEDDD